MFASATYIRFLGICSFPPTSVAVVPVCEVVVSTPIGKRLKLSYTMSKISISISIYIYIDIYFCLTGQFGPSA